MTSKKNLIVKVLIGLSAYCLYSCDSPNPTPSPYPPDASDTEETMVVCPACRGTGQSSGAYSDDVMYQATFGSNCSLCEGKGQCTKKVSDWFVNNSRQSRSSSHSQEQNNNRCPLCYGSGKCTMCAGRGEHIYQDYNGYGYRAECSGCHGGGRCSMCYGKGEVYN